MGNVMYAPPPSPRARSGRRLSGVVAALVLLVATALVWSPTSVSAQASDCTESLGTLSAGETSRTGNASASCTRYLPHGYAFVVDNGSGAAKAFTFTLDAAATVTVNLGHGTTYSTDDEPVLELIRGHHGHTTAIGTQLDRALDVNDLEAPIRVGVALAAGDYTAQIANYDWQYAGGFSYQLTISVGEPITDDAALVLSGTTENTYREDYTSSVAEYGVISESEDDETVTWALSGDDSGDFAISSSGVLTFSTQPDYETPSDNNSDNEYEFTVTATRGASIGSLDVEITVTDLDENLEDENGGI